MKIKYLVMDVDGTMTDGAIYYDNNGNELKKFNTKDAVGFFCAKEAGIKLVVLTGRECNATLRRMQEMKVDYIFQNVKDKHSALTKFMENNGVSSREVAYIGDDLNDFNVMKISGFKACPLDADPAIIDIADYVSPRKGGEGVIRDVVKKLLESEDIYQKCISKVYRIN
jgi:3-deoxy-D-manno-octulosonate 8-phosphate phosphatase (KDO 8-P phosphatase)